MCLSSRNNYFHSFAVFWGSTFGRGNVEKTVMPKLHSAGEMVGEGGHVVRRKGITYTYNSQNI
jgi:hypothetical protein